jgi:hypothetical protein
MWAAMERKRQQRTVSPPFSRSPSPNCRPVGAPHQFRAPGLPLYCPDLQKMQRVAESPEASVLGILGAASVAAC